MTKRSQVLSKINPPGARFVIAVEHMLETEFLVCERNVHGPIAARFPRTFHGYAAAVEFTKRPIQIGGYRLMPYGNEWAIMGDGSMTPARSIAEARKIIEGEAT